MALSDLYSNLHLLLRWIHILAGIIWLGHLYFFNFVNLPVQAAIDDNTKKAINPELMPRALFWFRHGANFTLLSGLALFSLIYMYTPGEGFGPSALMYTGDGEVAGRVLWITLGMALGVIMWFNVWFIIWPAQKAIMAGEVPQDQIAAVRRRAGLASRINTFLSGPMLFGMIAPSHYGAINPVTAGIAILLGLIAIGKLIFVSGRACKKKD